jgi:hypothetical protein
MWHLNKDMSHDLVCAWLGLPSKDWPPDHYTLLGLPSGEPDMRQIEERVHDQLMRLRPYQLNHPEEVTEAMNRLARAFSCLTDPTAKKDYDAWLSAPRTKQLDRPQPAESSADPLVWLFGPWSGLAGARRSSGEGQDKLADWRQTPPPLRRVTTSDRTPLPEAMMLGENGAARAPMARDGAVALPPPAPAGPIDSFLEAARSSAARRGLSTRRSLCHRMRATRKLMRAWEIAGKYVNHPAQRLARPRERVELTRHLRAVSRLLKTFPPLLGQLGQPGFWVVSLARHEMVIPIFRMLVPSQRETLARDWRDGLAILKAHRQFLLLEARVMRNQSAWGRFKRRVRFLFSEHPSLWGLVVFLLVVALLDAIGVLIWLAW